MVQRQRQRQRVDDETSALHQKRIESFCVGVAQRGHVNIWAAEGNGGNDWTQCKQHSAAV
ncbi:hypothetical protein H9L39_02964 [Fusarium oxysporum f. sp. albedinis]|nr:hypothetical protein H9L39_02964 [Fusarium oxysporum f. sp. albedinis]